MIRRIRSHNILNGILFSVSEFAFIALVITPFAFYYLTHEKHLYALVAIGIIFNSLTIVTFGWIQLRRKEKDVGISDIYEKSYREKAIKENPQLFGDTLILVATILLPFVLLIMVFSELLFISKGI